MAVVGFVASPTARAVDPEAHQGNKVTFPGNDGQPHEVTWDKNSFMVDGERLQIWSGELHHWRVPSEDGWRDVLQKLRASGYNAVSLYFFWGMHQSEEGGEFDFSAPHDLDRLLTMAAEEGLYVIARPGPYINAEVSMGGLPGYMVNKSAWSLRSTDPSVLEPSKEWLHAFNQIAKEHQLTDGGGSIIMYQVENELITDDANRRAFLKELAEQVKADGITVPLFHNDYGMGGRFSDSENLGLDYYAYDRYPLGFNCSAGRNQIQESEAAFRNIAPDSPNFVTEAQGGAFTPWGANFTPERCAEFTDPAFTRQWGVGNFGNGVTAFNYYMIIGGTNWGYSGAPASGFTSYDYGAALDEDRVITPKLATQKELGYFQDALPELLTMDPVAEPAVNEHTGAPVKVYQRQAIEDLENSVTGNGARFIGARLADSNNTTETSFTIPLVLDAGEASQGSQFSDDDRSPALTFTGDWTQTDDVSAHEGSLTSSSTAGDSVTYSFNGTGLEVIAPQGTSYGMATISVDGGEAEEFTSWYYTDQNAPTQSVVRSVTGLAPGQHTVTITVAGEAAPESTSGGTTVAIDALNVLGGTGDGGILVNDDDTEFITYSDGHWEYATGQNWTAGDINGDETFSNQSGAWFEFTFEGVGFQLIAAHSSNHGPGRVFVDDVEVGLTEEEVTSNAVPQQVIFEKMDLEPGTHTVRVERTGDFFPGAQDSRGAFLSLDAVKVYPTAPEAEEPEVPSDAVAWARIPQQEGTKLHLHGRDAIALAADFNIGTQGVYYTTSQLFGAPLTTADGVLQTLVGHPGDPGETVLAVDAEHNVGTPDGVTSSYDAETGQLRLNYTHGEPVDVTVTDGDQTTVLRLLDRDHAADVWQIEGVDEAGTGNLSVVVDGAYLARTVTFEGTTAHITGSMAEGGELAVTLPAGITSWTWNGETLTGAAPGPEAVAEPELQWVMASENPESAVDYDDSDWTVANATNALNRYQGPGSNGVVLDSNRYGFFEGSVWYRASYTAATSNPTLTFRGNGGSGVPGHGKNPAFLQVWVNGLYAGARPASGGTVSVPAPAGAVTAGEDVVVAVLVHNLGHNLDWSDDGLSRQNRGLYEANLAASGPVSWKIQGAQYTEADAADPVRGLYNRGGLYGERAGWYLPGYPDSDWAEAATLEASEPGVTWYRASADLDVPEGQDTVWHLEIESSRFDAGRTDGSQVDLYVNGWLIGTHIGDIGPQKAFTIPAGFLDPRGHNEIAVSVAAKSTGMGPQDIRLVPVHSTTGTPADFAATEAPGFVAPSVSVEVDVTEASEGDVVTASGSAGALPVIAEGADVELRYLWSAPGGEPEFGEASRELSSEGTHTVQAVLVDVVSGQALATSAAAEVVVGEGSTSEPTEEPTGEPTEEPTGEPTEEPTEGPTGEPTEEPTGTPTTTPPAPQPTVTVTAEPVNLYTTPGFHRVNGRSWYTECEPYSITQRCTTDIWATQVTYEDGQFVKTTGWVFNNLTYLPSPRAAWANNPLGYTGAWTAEDGRKWYTECDTATTGKNGCRSYILTSFVKSTQNANGSWSYAVTQDFVFNNMVLFR
ncbi:beta-galactosidase [Tessaracoccus terricola]